MPEDQLQPAGPALTRVELLRRGAGALVGLSSAGTVLAACGSSSSSGSTATTSDLGKVGGTVTFLGWQGYDDRKAGAAALKRGINLSTTYITNNDEIVTKLRAGGRADIVTPYFGYVKPLADAGLISPLDMTRLPASKQYFPQFVNPESTTVDGKTYAAPLIWADTPMIYRPDLIRDLPASYRDLANPRYKGKLVTLDDALSNILIFAKTLFGDQPTRITTDQLKQVEQLMGTVRPNIVTVGASFGDILDVLMRGDAGLCITGWRFLQAQAAQKGRKLGAHTPKEGSFSYFDTYCIPAKAKNQASAYAFIDAVISATGNAVVAANTGSACTNSTAVARLPRQQRKLYPYNDISSYFKTNGLYGLPPLEADGDVATFQQWQATWQRLKSA